MTSAAVSEGPERVRVWRSSAPVSLGAILSIFRHGGGDPAYGRRPDGTVVRAVRTPAGSATLELQARPTGSEVTARAWGPGAEWALESVPALLGDSDDASGFVAHHELVRQAARRFPGWRVPRSQLVVDSLVPVIIEQKVTGEEAFRGYRQLVRRFGEPAPGPYAAAGLMLPPSPAGWAAIPSWQFLKASVDPARSRTIVTAVRRAGRLEEAVGLPPAQGRERLRLVPGIGVWTAAEVAQRALGDADAVSYGDYHVGKNITWALLGEARDDDVLAELLEPYAGHRYRVQRLLELSGYQRPRHGPRMSRRTHLPR